MRVMKELKTITFPVINSVNYSGSITVGSVTEVLAVVRLRKSNSNWIALIVRLHLANSSCEVPSLNILE